MADETHDKIDRFFNVLDATIDEASHLINRGLKTGNVIDRAKARQVIDVDPRDVRPSPATAIARTSKVRIIESIDAQSGQPMFVVTDGVERSECSTRALAERVKRAMELP